MFGSQHHNGSQHHKYAINIHVYESDCIFIIFLIIFDIFQSDSAICMQFACNLHARCVQIACNLHATGVQIACKLHAINSGQPQWLSYFSALKGPKMLKIGPKSTIFGQNFGKKRDFLSRKSSWGKMGHIGLKVLYKRSLLRPMRIPEPPVHPGGRSHRFLKFHLKISQNRPLLGPFQHESSNFTWFWDQNGSKMMILSPLMVSDYCWSHQEPT